MIRNFSVLFVLEVSQIVLSAFSVQAWTKFDSNKTFNNLNFAREFDYSNILGSMLTFDWTNNNECFYELNEIKNGIINREEWAIRFVDSWGKFPSGLLNGNLHEMGSFPECLNIKRNEKRYKTQYCMLNVVMKDPNIFNISKIYRDGTLLSLGVCLPATCEISYLSYILNTVAIAKGNNVAMGFPPLLCQTEERARNWRPLDLVTIGLLGFVLFLMAASTGYDIFYTVYNRTKYQPFVVFSIYTNGKRLFACTPPSTGTIQCLDGIRVLSIMWIVYNHIYRRYSFIPLREPTVYDKYTEAIHSALSNATMPVNTFFVIGGLLVSNKLFKLLKKDGKLDILSLYWNRYLRLTPALAVCILVTISILRFCGDGPLWLKTFQITALPCEQYWWSSLLFVQNYVNPNNLCLFPTWYLSVDTQLFVISPILVYLIHRYKKTSLIALLILILSCVGYSIFLYTSNNLRLALEPKYGQLVYYPTHVRFPPWLIGFITGYILFEFPKESICIPKKVNVCAWTIILSLMPIIVLANYPFNQDVPIATSLEYGLIEPLSHIIWSIAVCYIIFACRYDSGGPVNSFLSLTMWQPLSKLSYMIYLNHYLILLITFYSIETPQYFSELLAFRNYISTFVLATFIAIPMTLAFELPIDAINKLTNGSNKQKGQQINTSVQKSNETEFNGVIIEKFVTKNEMS